MLSRKSFVFIAAGGLLAAACSSFHKSPERDIASVRTWELKGASETPSNILAGLSSSGNMHLSNAKVITDNNRAFQSKLDIVRNAKRELRMVYYIYNDDFSSSVFNTEVIAAARRGVKVKLLVDFITNYDRLDLFSYLEGAGQGNIEVRFYGLPTATILSGAVYQTLPCSKGAVKSSEQCQNEKMALIQQMGNPQSTWFSKMYLSGLYSKNVELMKMAIGVGAQFDPKTLMSGPTTPQQKADLKKFAKLVVAAKLKNDVMSKMKMAIALQTYGTTLNPIMNEITGRLPIENGHGQDWDHITDYTHHKLIVADGERFQLGGRNVEDSYHTDSITAQIKDSKGKYTFMDTDFYGESPESRRVELAYDRLFSFSAMVGGLQKVQALVPNEYDMNTTPFQMSLGACLQAGKATPADLESCVTAKMPSMPGYKSLAARMEDVKNNMATKSQRFVAEYKIKSDKSWKSSGDSLDASDLRSAEAFYFENLTYNHNKPEQRIFGSVIGAEAEHGKYLHSAWLKGLENVCATSTKEQRQKRVIIHSAYLYLPSELVNALGNMMNGKWKCHYVDVALITNSFDTTDLNVINVFARYQVQALLEYNQNIERSQGAINANQNKARFHYYEYIPSKEGTGISLHTKVSVLGDDMIIGSANADVRSYFMDTNNGAYLRGAPQLVANYTAFVDRIIAEKRVMDLTGAFANMSTQNLNDQNAKILAKLLHDYDSKGRVTPEKQKEILERIGQLGGQIQASTKEIINAPTSMSSSMGDSGAAASKATELENLANRFNQIWKVL